MSCRHYREDIGLLAGRDLTDSVRVADVRAHLSTCAACRGRYGRIRDGLGVLGTLSAASTFVEQSPGVWPGLRTRLTSPPPPTAARPWPLIGAVGLTAAVAAWAAFSASRPDPDRRPDAPASERPVMATDDAPPPPGRPPNY